MKNHARGDDIVLYGTALLLWHVVIEQSNAGPNPRHETYVEATRPGPKVCILLGTLYNDPASPPQNTAMVVYANSFAGIWGVCVSESMCGSVLQLMST